jgi:hypothetical protein
MVKILPQNTFLQVCCVSLGESQILLAVIYKLGPFVISATSAAMDSTILYIMPNSVGWSLNMCNVTIQLPKFLCVHVHGMREAGVSELIASADQIPR